MRLYRPVLLVLSLFLLTTVEAVERKKCNFNSEWRLQIGDPLDAATTAFDDSRWRQVTLPYAFNGDEAFRRDIVDLTDTICWYRKHFELKQEEMVDRKYFIEFEGVRQGADFYLNGQHLGYSENGVMACGFDLTPYIKEGDNVLAVRCDNSWTYESRQYQSRYQWNDRNFNANYGGIPKNVWLHVTGKLYQTLPLYSNLGTTGTYVYATDFDIANHKATIHVESQVRNEDSKPRSFRLFAKIINANNYLSAIIPGERVTLQPGETRVVSVQRELSGLHFWSWGYGYLYTVKTYLAEDGADAKPLNLNAGNDEVVIRTGFRKTRFGELRASLAQRLFQRPDGEVGG